MSLHINRFVDNIKAHEARGQRDFTMSLRDAKDLHGDVTKLLLMATTLQQQVLALQQEQTITVEVQGSGF
jgi:hypothetical protein